MRTIELILGLPPMSQYDAAAVPLYDCFTNKPNLSPYIDKPAQVNLEQRNIAVNESSKRSESFNLAKEDAVPDLDLNEVIWKSVKRRESCYAGAKTQRFCDFGKERRISVRMCR